YHDQAERLVPLDREEERPRVAQELDLRLMRKLAQVLDGRARGADARLDLGVVELHVHPVRRAADAQAYAREARGVDGMMRPFLRREPPEERAVAAVDVAQRVKGRIEAVVNDVRRRELGHRLELPPRDADVRDAGKFRVETREVLLARVVERHQGR